jgi:hypothetical protein
LVPLENVSRREKGSGNQNKKGKNMASDTIEIRLMKKGPSGRPYAEILVPKKTSLDRLIKAQETLYTDGLKAVGLAACPRCYSGLDFFIRQHFEDVIRVG